jgi:hypothetical protein
VSLLGDAEREGFSDVCGNILERVELDARIPKERIDFRVQRDSRVNCRS